MAFNLLTNPSFEVAPYGTPPVGWSVLATGAAIAFSQPDSSAFEARHDVRLSVSSPAEYVRLFQAVVIPERTTNFLVTYGIRETVGSNGRARARIRYFDEQGNQLSYEIVQTVAAGSLRDPAWQTHTYVSGAIPAAAVTAQLELTLGGEVGDLGDVEYDNVALVPLA